MVTKLHRHMGAMIRKNVKASLPKNSYIHISSFFYGIGNMLPDISWLPLTHPHFASRSLEYAFDKISLTLKKHQRHRLDQLFISPLFSLRLGVASHYLCDFFCVAHQSECLTDPRRHLDYEHRMRDFYYTHRKQMESLCSFSVVCDPEQHQNINTRAIMDIFHTWHQKYQELQSSFIAEFENTPSINISMTNSTEFITDIKTAIACCTSLVCALALSSTVISG